MARVILAIGRVVVAGLLSLPAVAPAAGFDPLFTGRSVPQTATKSMLPAGEGQDPCRFAPPVGPLGLVEAVERALCSNPQTRQAWASTRAQAAQLGVSRAAYLPTVVASIASTRSTYRYEGLDFDLKARTNSGGLRLSWVLADFGGRSASLDAARALLEAANATHDAALQTAFLNAAQGYFETLTAQAALDAAREAERSAGENFKAAEAKYQAGAGALTDQLQAQTSYSQAILDRVKAEGDLKSVVGAFATAIGLPASTPLVLARRGDKLPDTTFVKSVEELMDEARRNHPALVAAEAQVKAARARVSSVRAEGLPTLALTGEMNRNRQLEQTPLSTYESNRIVGVQLSVPLFEGFGRNYKVRSAEAEVEGKQAEQAAAEQRILLDVWKAYQVLGTEGESLKTTDDFVRNARQSYEVALGRYKAGVGNILELLNAQSAVANARQQRIKSLSNWHTARLKLAASVGKLGLWAIE